MMHQLSNDLEIKINSQLTWADFHQQRRCIAALSKRAFVSRDKDLLDYANAVHNWWERKLMYPFDETEMPALKRD